MSYFTQTRRWMMDAGQSKAFMTEETITADEARVALFAIAADAGFMLYRVREYDPRADKYRLTARDNDNYLRVVDITVPGEAVAKVVRRLRAMMGAPMLACKRLGRASEKAKRPPEFKPTLTVVK